eukprot:2412353-Prymnesium_polylepis.1
MTSKPWDRRGLYRVERVAPGNGRKIGPAATERCAGDARNVAQTVVYSCKNWEAPPWQHTTLGHPFE